MGVCPTECWTASTLCRSDFNVQSEAGTPMVHNYNWLAVQNECWYTRINIWLCIRAFSYCERWWLLLLRCINSTFVSSWLLPLPQLVVVVADALTGPYYSLRRRRVNKEIWSKRQRLYRRVVGENKRDCLVSAKPVKQIECERYHINWRNEERAIPIHYCWTGMSWFSEKYMESKNT